MLITNSKCKYFKISLKFVQRVSRTYFMLITKRDIILNV